MGLYDHEEPKKYYYEDGGVVGGSPDMHVHVHVHIEPDPRIDKILSEIKQLTKEEKKMATDLTALTEQVTNNTDVVQSAIALISGLAAELQAAGTDPIALQSLVDELNTNNVALASAVTANTPAAPPAV